MFGHCIATKITGINTRSVVRKHRNCLLRRGQQHNTLYFQLQHVMQSRSSFEAGFHKCDKERSEYSMSMGLRVLISYYHSLLLFYKAAVSLCLYVCMSVCLSVRLSVSPSVRLSVCPSVCLSVCLSVCTPLFSTRPSNRNQIWHTYSGSHLKKLTHPTHGVISCHQ